MVIGVINQWQRIKNEINNNGITYIPIFSDSFSFSLLFFPTIIHLVLNVVGCPQVSIDFFHHCAFLSQRKYYSDSKTGNHYWIINFEKSCSGKIEKSFSAAKICLLAWKVLILYFNPRNGGKKNWLSVFKIAGSDKPSFFFCVCFSRQYLLCFSTKWFARIYLNYLHNGTYFSICG